MDEIKVAFTSTDGEFSDLHFGRAGQFYIHSLDGDGESAELREVPKGTGHSADHLEKAAELLSDCTFLVTARIGYPAAAYLIGRGLRVLESEFAVRDILNKIRADYLQRE